MNDTNVKSKDGTFEQIAIDRYYTDFVNPYDINDTLTKTPYIAIVYAEGDIVHGESMNNQVSDRELSKTLRQLRTDASCKAIVMRVNSPGGSAFASDLIQRESLFN